MTNKIRNLTKLGQHVWYPEPQKCGVCHKPDQDLYHIEYQQLGSSRDVYWTAAACAACVRDMRRD